jgi:hypothetical protein
MLMRESRDQKSERRRQWTKALVIVPRSSPVAKQTLFFREAQRREKTLRAGRFEAADELGNLNGAERLIWTERNSAIAWSAQVKS